MEFKVKRDFLSIFITNLVLLLLIGISLPFAYNAWVFVVVFGICFALLCFYNTAVIFATCKLTKKELIYRTGAFKYNIQLENIVKVEKAKNIYASLALSVQRIRILTKKDNKQKVYYISVLDEDKLIELLTKKEEKPVAKENKPIAEKKVVKKSTKQTTTRKSTAKKTTTTQTKKTTK